LKNWIPNKPDLFKTHIDALVDDIRFHGGNDLWDEGESKDLLNKLMRAVRTWYIEKSQSIAEANNTNQSLEMQLMYDEINKNNEIKRVFDLIDLISTDNIALGFKKNILKICLRLLIKNIQPCNADNYNQFIKKIIEFSGQFNLHSKTIDKLLEQLAVSPYCQLSIELIELIENEKNKLTALTTISSELQNTAPIDLLKHFGIGKEWILEIEFFNLFRNLTIHFGNDDLFSKYVFLMKSEFLNEEILNIFHFYYFLFAELDNISKSNFDNTRDLLKDDKPLSKEKGEAFINFAASLKKHYPLWAIEIASLLKDMIEKEQILDQNTKRSLLLNLAEQCLFPDHTDI
jgi:hypothetical protein